MKLLQRLRSLDFAMFMVVLVILLLSIATIYTVTFTTVGLRLALSQIVFAGIGVGLFILFSLIDYRSYKSQALWLWVAGLILLVPLLPFVASRLPFVICEFNACRWIDMGFFRLQTSEVFKAISVLTLSAFLVTRPKFSAWHFVVFLAVVSLPVLLIIEQPDLGTAVVVALSALTLLTVVRFPNWVWIVLLTLVIAGAPLAWRQLKPYQKQRIEVFLNPELDPNRTGYNVRQSEIAVGSGGIWGKGFGQGSQSQLNFLPVAHTDFIFAGYAEAAGLLGGVVLLSLYAFLLWRMVGLAEKATDPYARLVAIGIAAIFGLQICINIGMNIRLMPVTGVPLPLMSYGGTSLFVSMILLGIIQNIRITSSH